MGARTRQQWRCSAALGAPRPPKIALDLAALCLNPRDHHRNRLTGRARRPRASALGLAASPREPARPPRHRLTGRSHQPRKVALDLRPCPLEPARPPPSDPSAASRPGRLESPALGALARRLAGRVGGVCWVCWPSLVSLLGLLVASVGSGGSGAAPRARTRWRRSNDFFHRSRRVGECRTPPGPPTFRKFPRCTSAFRVRSSRWP